MEAAGKNHFCPDCGSTVHMLLLPEPSLSSSQDRGKVPRARQCGRVHARIWEIKRLRVHDFDSGIPPWRKSPFRNGQHTREMSTAIALPEGPIDLWRCLGGDACPSRSPGMFARSPVNLDRRQVPCRVYIQRAAPEWRNRPYRADHLICVVVRVVEGGTRPGSALDRPPAVHWNGAAGHEIGGWAG